MVEFISGIMGDYGMLITIATIMVIAFARCIIKIFRMGVMFNSDLATKNELKSFEEEIRRDMRGYAIQIQESVLKSVMIVVENKLRDIQEAKNAAVDIKVTKAELEVEIKNALSKLDDVKSLGDSVRQLNQRVSRIEFNNNQAASMPERRNN